MHGAPKSQQVCVLPQVLTLGMAYALSEVQRRELEASRDEEEEDWGRRSRMQQPLLTTSCATYDDIQDHFDHVCMRFRCANLWLLLLQEQPAEHRVGT